MREEIFEDIDLDTQPKDFSFSLPIFKENIDPVLILLIVLTSSSIVIVSIKFRIFHLWVEFLGSNIFLRIATYPLLISAIVIVTGIAFRTILWFRYKPLTIKEGETIDWPFVTVIMPALNEEELIERSIDSIFVSNYPQDKFEVICINDGSSDLTYFYMMKAKQKYRDRLRVINFKENLGKRKALYVGLKKSRGEIIVTVDTDSKIGRSAIRNLIIPLIKDKKTGAVAGRVAVLNEKENFLTRMLSIRYSISFNFGRAYQSIYISQLIFDSEQQVLSIGVSGENGTAGYVKIVLSKALVPDLSVLHVYLDDESVSYNTESTVDSWTLTVHYHHSTHTVKVSLSATSPWSGNQLLLISFGIVAAALFTFLYMKSKPKTLAP